MSTVYEPSTAVDPLKSILPLRRTLKTNQPILITSVTTNSSPSLLNQLHKIFNEIIEEGTTYPQEFFLDYDGFINLFLSHNTFVVFKDDVNENVNENWDDKIMGYKSSVFNLVFENNIASIKLWKSLGFKEVGKIPKAGRLKGSDKLIDALMFYYDFEEKNQKFLNILY
ncbi:14731_t:CDS:2 [Dentiscutata heterogama]|uniref:14731_t:CDS:1 n=1 Tax=Dentiscutata heterogama TaxID=1316150 RepID=A0ACA9K2A1_9GLOM|nr:14731_t:CDS:2 [Dentiscutata heterogama]